MAIATRSGIALATLSATMVCLPGAAVAQPAVGLDVAGTTLVGFDTASPGTTTTTSISGLLTGEALAGLDRRPATGALYGLGVTDIGAQDELRLYRVDPVSGVATRISAAPYVTPVDGTEYGTDFNPAVDRLRVVNDANLNLRLNPNNGTLAGSDPNLTDAVLPDERPVKAIAYAMNVPFGLGSGSSTLFAIGSATNQLATIGGFFGGEPGGANGGSVTAHRALGVAAAANVDLEVADSAGTAFMADAGNFYTVNLATGAATLVGALAQPLRGLTTLPSVVVTLRDRQIETSEAAGVALITVTRSSTAAPASVRVTTQGTALLPAGADTATAGDDFATVDVRVHFLTGQSQATIGIPIVGATDGEAAETFTVYAADPGPTTITPAPGTIVPVGLGVDTDLGADRATVTIAADPVAVSASAPPSPPADTTGPFAVLVPDASSARRSTLASRGLTVRYVCGEPCGGRLTLKLGHSTLASATSSLKTGGLGSVRLRLSRSGRSALAKALKRARTARLEISAGFTDTASNATAGTRHITARR